MQTKFNSKIIFSCYKQPKSIILFSTWDSYSKKIKFPTQVKYASQTNIDGKAGIISFHDRKLEITNRDNNIKIIFPGYAIFNKIKIGS